MDGRPWTRRLTLLSAVFLAGLVLAACAVRLVSGYDEQIDAGLSQLNTDVTAFVNEMIGEAGTPRGTWAANKDFYIVQEARLDTLILRAEAHKALDSCPSTAAATTAVENSLPTSDLAKYAGQIPQGDCSVVLLRLIKNGIVDLATFHKAQGDAGIPASAHDIILVGGVGSLIHSAIVVEMAKRNAERGNGPGGT